MCADRGKPQNASDYDLKAGPPEKAAEVLINEAQYSGMTDQINKSLKQSTS
jgi:hypothetical protein